MLISGYQKGIICQSKKSEVTFLTPESASVKIMRFFFTGPEAAWRDAIFFHKRFVKNRIITKAALFGNFFQWKAGIDQIFRFDQSPLGNDFVKAGVKLLLKAGLLSTGLP